MNATHKRRSTNVSNLSLLAEIEDDYRLLADGVSTGGNVCPSCRGGRSKEGSFTVTRQGNLLKFKCHRNSCGFSGVTQRNGRPAVLGEPVPQRERKPARPDYADLRKGPLPQDVISMLGVRYCITPVSITKGQLQWTEEYSPAGHGRVLMPVFDENGQEYGYTVRKFDDQPGAKTLSYLENGKGSWYFGPPRTSLKQLIIVEDQLSALRASHYLNSVALLGTNVTDGTLKVLKERKFDNVYIALDPDAFPTSIKLARRLRDAGVNVTVVKLTKDIKNMNDIELLDWLTEMDINWYE